MNVLDWALASGLFIIYLVCLVTVCVLTFKKGYIVLGIFGIFFPFLWLIGAILPAKPGSSYDRAEMMRMRSQVEHMTM